MRRYDEDYRYFVSRLNSAYDKRESRKASGPALSDRISRSTHKFIEDMSGSDMQKVSAKVRSRVADISFLTKEEKELLGEIRKGKQLNYRQAICRMTGEIRTDKIMNAYNQLWNSESVFRTVYLYKGMETPVRVVSEAEDVVFPIHDLRGLSRDMQNLSIKNALAAEARRQFNIETDPVLRIQGYLTGQKELIAVLSYYPHISFPIGLKGILYKIFSDLKQESGNVSKFDEETIQQMNEELRAQSIAYWKKILLPFGKRMLTPGEQRLMQNEGRPEEKTFLHKELPEKLVESLNGYCKQNQVSPKSLFLLAWGKLFGKYNDEKDPLLLVAKSGGQMNLFPVRVNGKYADAANLSDVERQLAEAVNYNSCTNEELEEATGISFEEYFGMAHHFMEFRELDDMVEGNGSIRPIDSIDADEIRINLLSSYHLFEKNISINYFARNGMMEMFLENLHTLFVNELSVIVSFEKKGFDKSTFIKVSDSDAEKLHKIRTAQIALYLKESGLFDTLEVEEIMKLAEYCKLSSYLSSDEVVLEKDQIANLYIVGDGKLEESRTAPDGMVKSLRIVKKGSVFGIESLYPEGKASTTYTVVTSQAKIVEISASVLKEVFRGKPDGWIALLQKETDQKLRLQRLWMME